MVTEHNVMSVRAVRQHMPVSGYDPDDIDDALERMLEDREVEDFLSEDERRQWESGESLVDLLDEDDIRKLLDRGDVQVG